MTCATFVNLKRLSCHHQIADLMKKHDSECMMLPGEPPHAPEPDFEELRHAFEIMGLTLPQALLGEEHQLSVTTVGGGGTQNGLQNNVRAANKTTVKIRVKLPDGTHAALKLTEGSDVGTQVAQFLDDNGMQTDTHAFEKLVNAGTKALKEQVAKAAGASPDKESINFSARSPPRNEGSAQQDDENLENRCIVRVKLPNGQVIETTVGQEEDAQLVASRIAEEYGLSMGYQNKVWEQLRTAQLQQSVSTET